MQDTTYAAFTGDRLLAHGSLAEVLHLSKAHLDGGGSLLIFEDCTGRQVDFDFRGTLDDVLTRVLPPAPRQGPGRPKIGVTAREVTLLPRHWQWLDEQSGGASATLRRLIDEARKRDDQRHRTARAAEATGRFLTALAGNRPHFEDTTRALYAGDRERFTALTNEWPTDIRRHALYLAQDAFLPTKESKERTA